jgi:peptidoglycan/LPS O-acetylase OafA/YrhL
MKTSTFKAKVARRVRWWVASTVIILAILLLVGYAVTTLIIAIPVSYQSTLLYIFGAAGTIVAFVLGQAVNSILVRGWDVWIGSLGSTQIAVLIPELERQKARLEKEET